MGLIEATSEDYMATLATITLIRSGLDSFPVDTKNLLRHVVKIERKGETACFSKDETGYTVSIPKNMSLSSPLCAELLLSILMDKMGRPLCDEPEKARLVSVFSCHLLCPRPVFRLTGRTWSSRSFLEKYLGLPRYMAGVLSRCPSCYVPADLNIRLHGQIRQHFHPPDGIDKTNEIALRMYLYGYEDEEYRLRERPALKISRLQEAVDALIPEHVLAKGHPASLYIEYCEDFPEFHRQFATIDLEILYRLVFDESPPLPLFGGMPAKDSADYAEKADRYLSRESAARLCMANLLYQRKYRPDDVDILSDSIRELYHRR